MKLKISIIVPVYKVRDYIIRCMDSLINQTFKNFEIIIINDETPDDSIDLIQEKYNDSRIKIFNKKNGGAASARNYGVKKARGDYLFFVDPDDFIELNTLELMYQAAINNYSDLVFCDYYKYYNENNYSKVSLIEHYQKDNPKSVITAMPGAVCRLINRELYQKNKIEFLENYCFEDNAIMPLLGAIAKKPYYLQKNLYYYFQREGSALNSQKYDKKWEDIFVSLEYLKQKFIEFKLEKECFQELEYIYLEYLLHASNLRFFRYEEGIKNIKKTREIIKKEFPNFRKNKYYKQESFKYKIVCNLFYYNQIKLLTLILKK